MSAYLQPGSAAETTPIEPEEDLVTFIGRCESCECDVDEQVAIIIRERLYHEHCAERITDFGGTAQ